MIYEALVKVTKALTYFRERYGVGGYALHLFTPIIVLDGNLWSASLSRKSKVQLKNVDHLFVLFGQLNKDENDKFMNEEDQICDIVTRNSFVDYLRTIKKDNKEIYKFWTNSLR